MSNADADEILNSLVSEILGGNEKALSRFIELLWPEWLKLIGSGRILGRLARSQDDVRNVALRVLEKFSHNRGEIFQYFTEWKSRNPEKSFKDWMRIVVANVSRDYLRQQKKAPVHQDSEESGEWGRKRILNDFAVAVSNDGPSHRPPYTDAQTAKGLLEFAVMHLSQEQFSALSYWLSGNDYDQIATCFSLNDEEDARKLVRAALATLRRRFVIA